MLFDTDVLIWVFRGNTKAASRVEEAQERLVSVVTLTELFGGARDRKEVRLIKDFLADLDFRTLPLTENIGHRAVIYTEEHGLRSGPRLADALIAATAVENNLALVSGDARHYRALADLDLAPFKP
jgi:predicted nucleic acid-binding protein